jgi:hypothetical protein
MRILYHLERRDSPRRKIRHCPERDRFPYPGNASALIQSNNRPPREIRRNYELTA